jgi:putative PEP-CTERM system histidine kinase
MSLDLIIAVAAALLATVLAAVGLGRRPRHPAQYWFALGLVLLALEALASAAVLQAETAITQWWWEGARCALAVLAMGPWILFSVSYSRSDPGRAVSLGWRLGAGAALVFFLLLIALPEAVIGPREELRGPARLRELGYFVNLYGLVGSVAILTNLERTYRHAVGVMRWRIKYMVLGVGILFVFRLFLDSQSLLYSAIDARLIRVTAPVLLLGGALVAVALRRAQAFSVDVYPSHAFLFRSLTILLAGLYLLIVGVLARVVTLVGGDAALPLKALFVLVALTVLAMGIMSDRVRLQLRRFLSRHLRRPSYDYRRVWATFTARTTSLVDEPSFCRAVVTWVSENFEVLSASIWLRDEGGQRLRFGGSTSLLETAAREMEVRGGNLEAVLPELSRQRRPINLDDPSLEWVDSLRRLNPGVFPHGGDRTCVSLCASGEFLGVLVVGDRVSGLELSEEDLDLLQCVGDQVAAGLLNIQLSRRLVRAKEMEAFQTMSAFFVHDLKNTASSLSLMFQNLEEHFADPEFRADALRAVGKSVQHLNDLISRLGLLRQELKLKPVESDPVEVVEAALAVTGKPASIELRRKFEPVPRVMMDPEQIHKVIQNLVLNALDALPAAGWIEVSVGHSNGNVVLSVADNGIGMTPEFLQRNLFRPFQTTKKRGLGIGMFQCKMIIEAHHGRIDVESAPGMGTTVRVLLPVTPDRT